MKKALFLLSLLVSGSLSSYAQETTKIEAEASKYADCKLIEDSKYSGGKALELKGGGWQKYPPRASIS